MPIFVHGYDYPWPDGRGLLDFLGWKIGPWFDETFNHKNYPRDTAQQLLTRHNIVKQFIDAFNVEPRVAQKYTDKVFHVDLCVVRSQHKTIGPTSAPRKRRLYCARREI